MSEAINAALKEWAIVCRALADGRQTLLIRKGGIREIKDGFEVTHPRFWLFPTYVHQKEADLVPAMREEFLTVQAAPPAPGTVPIQLYAEVADVFHVTDLDRLRHLTNRHILSWDCVASRFHYRNRPGVHVLLLRVFRRPDPFVVPQAYTVESIDRQTMASDTGIPFDLTTTSNWQAAAGIIESC